MEEVRFYMEESILKVESDTSVVEAAKLMADNHVGALLVSGNKNSLGIVTDVDFSHKVIAKNLDPKTTPVSNIMSYPLITLDYKKTMMDVFKTMRKNNIRHLGVTENKILVGIVSIKDFANYYNNQFSGENEASCPVSDSRTAGV